MVLAGALLCVKFTIPGMLMNIKNTWNSVSLTFISVLDWCLPLHVLHIAHENA
jgi:hypothetical protein